MSGDCLLHSQATPHQCVDENKTDRSKVFCSSVNSIWSQVIEIVAVKVSEASMCVAKNTLSESEESMCVAKKTLARELVAVKEMSTEEIADTAVDT